MDCVISSYQCSEESNRPGQECGYSGCKSMLSVSYSDSVVMPARENSFLVADWGPLYLKRSLPAVLTTTTSL